MIIRADKAVLQFHKGCITSVRKSDGKMRHCGGAEHAENVLVQIVQPRSQS